MKKAILIILVFALSVTVAGCGKKDAKNTGGEKGKQAQEQQQEPKSLFGWLKTGVGTECKVETPEGEVVIKSKGDNVKMSGFTYAAPQGQQTQKQSGQDPQTGHMLTTKEWMYIWSGTEGTKMNTMRMQEIAREMGDDDDEDQWDWKEMVGEMEKSGYQYNCDKKIFSGNEFMEPEGVEFTDMTQVMDDMMEMTKDLEKSMEESGMMDMEEMEKMMEELSEKYNLE